MAVHIFDIQGNTPPRNILASGGWLENLSDLRHGTLVWRPCWISGGYRLEAASRPIALYIVGIREAQGRNQHFMSGTGTWSSGFWLAMADCLGRFGRASHSTSRYHTPPRSWDKSKCVFNAKPEIMAMRSLLSAVQLRSCATIIRLRSSHLLQYMRHSLCIRPSNVTRHGAQEECLQAFYMATPPMLPQYSGCYFSRDVG